MITTDNFEIVLNAMDFVQNQDVECDLSRTNLSLNRKTNVIYIFVQLIRS